MQIPQKLREVVIIARLLRLRRESRRRRYFRGLKLEDQKKRKLIEAEIQHFPIDILSSGKIIPGLTVSLTSHGKRVKDFAPYAIYSIIKQMFLPSRIILNLDKNSWNDNNMPQLLKTMKSMGVEINYVTDLGPHTKLLPTLRQYPNDIIITVDDDIYYEPEMIKELYEAYLKTNGKTIICRCGVGVVREKDRYVSFNQLPNLTDNTAYQEKIPFGVAGVLYPPHIFTEEIFNQAVFRKLCPTADDVWFGIMELREHIPVEYVRDNSWTGTSIDRNEEYNADGSDALYMKNDLQGLNDIQWHALIQHYQL